MKIGLVRHFKVKKALPRKRIISRDEFLRWLDEYDSAELEIRSVDLGKISWEACYSSDLQRAVKTAGEIFKGKIVVMQSLREINLFMLFNANAKMPLILWMLAVRLKLLFSNRLTEDFKANIRSSLDKIISETVKDTLIVSHGFTMIYLRKELEKRGFKGESFNNPLNGKVYVFEK